METKFTEKGFLNQHLKVQMDNCWQCKVQPDGLSIESWIY